MAIQSTSSTGASALTTQATKSKQDIAGFAKNFDSFLTLLTQQLKYQDPLSPMDATQFTTQLVQFSSVEQQIKQNQNLESLLNMQQSIQIASASNYIGKTVEAGGRSTSLSGGQATISYRLDTPAKSVSIAIKNADGQVVRTLAGNTGSGLQTINWDGRSDTGGRLADGAYSFAVTAKDLRDQAMPVTTGFTGKIDSFEVMDNAIILRAGSARIPLGDVTAVRSAS
jgi:flagellar basal-body rod modification protein FlgD